MLSSPQGGLAPVTQAWEETVHIGRNAVLAAEWFRIGMNECLRTYIGYHNAAFAAEWFSTWWTDLGFTPLYMSQCCLDRRMV